MNSIAIAALLAALLAVDDELRRGLDSDEIPGNES
jgi:hypothetical protein